MIILCDEDVGTHVPRALALVGYDARAMVDVGWSGHNDIDWIPRAGSLGWLVFSCNKRVLTVPQEREAIQDSELGIVYLTNGEENLERVLWLLLVKKPWLECINNGLERPFVRFLSPTGRVSDAYTYRGIRLAL